MLKIYTLSALKTACLSLLALFLANTQLKAQMGAGTDLSYDGNGNYVTLAPGVVAGVTGDYTIETWVYWKGGLAFQRIFDFGNDQSNWIVLTPATPAGVARFGIDLGGSLQYVDGVTAFPINAWTHVAVTYNSTTNAVTIYINGVADATGTITTHLSALGSTTNNWLGKSEFSDPYFKGQIEEFRISNVVRYTANFTPPTMEFTPDANTVALYHFNEGSGQTTADASGNGFNGVLGATTAVEPAADPTWVVNSVLPVKLLDFNATADRRNGNVGVQWTASMDRASVFAVERSSNGVDFSTVGTLTQATGSATQAFSLRDDHPLEGRSYYRLKATEMGSASVYSKIVAVSFANSNELTVYPNPVKGSLISIELAQAFTGDVTISLTNAAGVQVLSQKLPAIARKQFQLNRTASMPAGSYLLEVRTGSNIQSKMIIWQ